MSGSKLSSECRNKDIDKVQVSIEILTKCKFLFTLFIMRLRHPANDKVHLYDLLHCMNFTCSKLSCLSLLGMFMGQADRVAHLSRQH